MQRQLGEKKPRRERETSFQKFLHLRAGLASTQPKPGESEGRRELAELAPPRVVKFIKISATRILRFGRFPVPFCQCQSVFKSRSNRHRGGRNRVTAVGRARPTFRVPTRRICSKKCVR